MHLILNIKAIDFNHPNTVFLMFRFARTINQMKALFFCFFAESLTADYYLVLKLCLMEFTMPFVSNLAFSISSP